MPRPKPKPPSKSPPAPLADALRLAIRRRVDEGVTLYAIAKAANMSPAMLYRFLDDGPAQRSLRLESADRLAAALGLTLRPID